MKKLSLFLPMLFLLLLLLPACSNNEDALAESGQDALLVYASFYPMYDFAAKIGGEKAQVHNMVPAGTEPHSWEPTAKDITALEKADVFIYNGAGMEHWVPTVLPVLNNKKLLVVEAAKGIALLTAEGHQHEEGEKEAETGPHNDPHVWLSPMNAKQQLETIKIAFQQADPANSAYYEANYAKYAAELDALHQEYLETISPLPNKDIVVAHQAFSYLCKEYGLNQIAIEGLSADSEPDPARMAEIIKFAKGKKLKYIFFEELVSPKVAETIAKEVGAQTAVLNPLGALSEAQILAGSDYFSVMRENLAALKLALQ